MQRPLTTIALLLSTAALGSCVGPPAPAPQAPQPIPVPAPAPAPRPAPAPVPTPSGDWRNWPVTPGTWSYRQDDRGSVALYGRAGEDAELTIRCDRTRQRIFLSRRGAGPARLTIRTSSTLRSLDALPTGGEAAYAAVELPPSDGILDAIGYSRGKFVVEGSLPTIVVPAWAETLRVVEDCRR